MTNLSDDGNARISTIEHTNINQPVAGSQNPLTLTFSYAYDRMDKPMLERAHHEAITAISNDIYF